MKYLCLGYFDPEKMNAVPKAEIEAVMAQCWPHMQELYKTGQVLIDAGLEVQTTRLQRVNGKVIVTDGPPSGVPEMIGSALLIEAESMEEAIRIASLHPTTQLPDGERFGWRMEIRPIHYFRANE